MEIQKRYWGKTVASFMMVLFTMPLGHALMIIMEHLLSPTALHYAAFGMGALGLLIVISGVFVKGDTKQTLCGLFGGLLFWTGWVEFLFMYYATRYGAHPELLDGVITTTTEYANGVAVSSSMFLNGEQVEGVHAIKPFVTSRPEYLIMQASFGFWTMFMVLYLFCTKTGCNFINWWQTKLFRGRKGEIVARPMTRHTSIVTFMELNMLLWSCYLLLMFCYDRTFLGEEHPVTLLIGVGCLVGAFYMFRRELRLGSWGANIRMAIATVIVFWTPVEILGRLDFFSEIWVAPLEHKTEMITILVAFLVLAAYLIYAAMNRKDRKA